MPVFISHKREDTNQALKIAEFLRVRRVICYVDVLDPMLPQSNDLTEYLLNRVKSCTHLMAVVSEATVLSWWVPFEVGVGSGIDKRISSYRTRVNTLPEFLSKWPILSTDAHLEQFVASYKNDRSISLEEGYKVNAAIQSADQFHRTLKHALGQ